ncbi:YkvI family membrane protein [Sedimentibacter hydroxybenzoicus]|uniref:YkvI family membrane protein n=1 Tax=Sedimentibacter hydroxybenzoicus TaxID=29345 RepID=UPI001C52780E|nr:hypothetical protein [Sedimentibacter hydroxybenzoicus]
MINNDVKQVYSIAGAFIAFLIGSGFATGQEIMQYFAAYGFMGLISAAIVLFLFMYAGVSFVTAGHIHKFNKGNDIFLYYCGKNIGRIYDYFSVIFAYMSFFVMIAGAGATLSQQFGLDVSFGCIAMAALSIVTVIFGLDNIVNIISKIGPVIATMAILLGLTAIFQNIDGLRNANVIPELDIMKASGNWLFSAFLYVGFNILLLSVFMSSIGARTKSIKVASTGAIFGAAGYSLAIAVIAVGLMANIEKTAYSQIPSLMLASGISSSVAIIFSLSIFAEIFTTAVPLLWIVSSRIAHEDTYKFKAATIILAVSGAAIGLKVPFNRLVNIIYVINGYAGIIFLFFMIKKSILEK